DIDINQKEGIAMNEVAQFSSAMAGKTPSGGEILSHFAGVKGNRGFEFGTRVPSLIEAQESHLNLEETSVDVQPLSDRLQKESLILREEIDKASMFEEIVGTSPALRTVLSYVSKVAPTNSTVLITGETGTGKELVARAIHRRSPRASRPFVSVNS